MAGHLPEVPAQSVSIALSKSQKSEDQQKKVSAWILECLTAENKGLASRLHSTRVVVRDTDRGELLCLQDSKDCFLVSGVHLPEEQAPAIP
jgi:hypothetical protein